MTEGETPLEKCKGKNLETIIIKVFNLPIFDANMAGGCIFPKKSCLILRGVEESGSHGNLWVSLENWIGQAMAEVLPRSG